MAFHSPHRREVMGGHHAVRLTEADTCPVGIYDHMEEMGHPPAVVGGDQCHARRSFCRPVNCWNWLIPASAQSLVVSGPRGLATQRLDDLCRSGIVIEGALSGGNSTSW